MATRSSTVQITMPQMGESVTEGTVLEWLKQVGRPGRGRRAPRRDLHRQGRRRGPRAGLRHADQDPGRARRDRAGRPGAGRDRGRRADATRRPREEPGGRARGRHVPGDGRLGGRGHRPRVAQAARRQVAVDDPLVEISTDKVDAEVPSPVAGTLAEILVEADETVPVGTVLCRIAARRRTGHAGGARTAAAAPGAEPRNGNGQATPVAARIATAHGIDVDPLHRHRPARPGDQVRRARRSRGRRRARRREAKSQRRSAARRPRSRGS